MPVYETGRTRDIVFEVSGNVQSKLKHLYPGFSFIAYDGGCDIYFYFLPTTIFQPYLRFSNLPSIAGTLNWGVNAGVLFDGEDTAGDFLEPADYNADYFLEQSVGFSGTVTIPGVKEVFEVVDLPVGDYSTIDGVNWPSFGGAAQTDGLPSRKITYYEVIPEGTTITVEGTLGGTATWTWVTPSDIPMGYPVQIIGDLTIGSSSAPEADDIVADWRVDFEGEQLTADWGTITPDAQGSFMDWDHGKAGFVAVMSGGLGESSGNLILTPPCRYNANFKAFSFGVNYPGSIGLWLWDKRIFDGSNWVYGYKTVTASPAHSETVVQHLIYLAGGTNFTTNATIDKQEWQGIRWNLDPANLNGEDSSDWRVQSRGTKWDALTVLQNATHDLVDGSDASGWVGSEVTVSSSGGSLIFAPDSGGAKAVAKTVDWNLEGYRFVDVRLKTTDANQSITIRLSHTDGENKSYTIQSGAADTFSAIRIDLCLPDDSADNDDTLDDDVYTQESRFPLEGSSSTVPQKSDATWGFNIANEIEITFPDGQTLTVDYIRLARKETTGWGEVSFLPAFEPFRAGWTDAQIKSQFWSNADGRVSDLAWQFKQAAGHGFFSITAAGDFIERPLGWETTMLTTFPADGYHNNDLEALLLWGGGIVWNGGDTFEHGVDLSVAATKTVKAQALWDEVQVYPGAGNVWGPGAYGEITEIGAAKQLRGQVWGLVFNTSGEHETSGAIVTLKTDPGGLPRGTGSSDDKGFYETGTPFGKKANHEAYAGSSVSPQFLVYNRFRHRRCWLVDRASAWVWNYINRSGKFYRAEVSDTGIIVRRSRTFRPLGSWAEESEIGVAGVIRPVLFGGGSSEKVWLTFENDGDVLWCFSNDDGRTWSEPVSAMAGRYPTGNRSQSGWTILASLVYDSGDSGPGRIRMRRRPPGSAALAAAYFATDETSAEIKIEEGTFHVFPANNTQDAWILSAIAEGETEPGEWISRDDGLTWKRVV